MNDLHVYQQYFAGECEYNGVPRKAAAVSLTASSGGGQIRYAVQITFFPHEDAEDYRITYDAFAEEVLYEAAGRRSKKREQVFLAELREHADVLAAKLGGSIYWEQPLIEARFG